MPGTFIPDDSQMLLRPDYLIVGSGLTKARVIARTAVDAGHSVLMVERRSHLGGNVHDHTHASGIRIHTYGPHYFRTSSDKIWEFVNRFATFYKYEPALKSWVDGHTMKTGPLPPATSGARSAKNGNPSSRPFPPTSRRRGAGAHAAAGV